jgi:pimeloyl-[acyl-carrier protein] methyl ester esterase
MESDVKKIFIHGWSFNKDIWKDYFNLENAVFLNLPCHSVNGNGYKSPYLESFKEILFREIENSDRDVILIGWSMGATVSILTALEKPKNLKKLILFGFSPKFKDKYLGHDPVSIRAFLLSLRKMYDATIYRFRKRAVNNEFKNIPLPQPKECGIEILEEYVDLDLVPKLKNVEYEVILIHGNRDAIVNPSSLILTSQLLPKARPIMINSHHAPFLENKELIIKCI